MLDKLRMIYGNKLIKRDYREEYYVNLDNKALIFSKYGNDEIDGYNIEYAKGPCYILKNVYDSLYKLAYNIKNKKKVVGRTIDVVQHGEYITIVINSNNIFTEDLRIIYTCEDGEYSTYIEADVNGDLIVSTMNLITKETGKVTIRR